MQTADFIPHAPSNDWDFEQTQPRDWPLAKVPLHWEVRTCVCSLTLALPNSNRWRPEGIWGKTKAIPTLPGHFQIALKSTEWCFYQQVLSLCDRNTEQKTTHLQQELCTLRITRWIPTFKINWLWLEGRPQHSANKSHPLIICDPKPSSNQGSSVILKWASHVKDNPLWLAWLCSVIPHPLHPGLCQWDTVVLRSLPVDMFTNCYRQTGRKFVALSECSEFIFCVQRRLFLPQPTSSLRTQLHLKHTWAVNIKLKRWYSVTWCLEAYLIFKRK